LGRADKDPEFQRTEVEEGLGRAEEGQNRKTKQRKEERLVNSKARLCEDVAKKERGKAPFVESRAGAKLFYK